MLTLGAAAVTATFAATMSLDRAYVEQASERWPQTRVGRAAAAWLHAYESSRSAGSDELGARYRAAEAWNWAGEDQP